MIATQTPRRSVLERAAELPVARPTDFVSIGGSHDYHDAPSRYRVIRDSSLRAQLIGRGYAVPAQSPRGPNQKPPIIKLLPVPTAAPATRRTLRAGRRVAQVITRESTASVSLEAMEAFVRRFRAVEGHVRREMREMADGAVMRAHARYAASPSDEAFAALGVAIAARRNTALAARKEAFALVAADTAFEHRDLARLFADDRIGEESP